MYRLYLETGEPVNDITFYDLGEAETTAFQVADQFGVTVELYEVDADDEYSDVYKKKNLSKYKPGNYVLPGDDEVKTVEYKLGFDEEELNEKIRKEEKQLGLEWPEDDIRI